MHLQLQTYQQIPDVSIISAVKADFKELESHGEKNFLEQENVKNRPTRSLSPVLFFKP
jgi:hypothetical protein